MRVRAVLSILLNLVAVAGPAIFLYFLYGQGATINPQSSRDLLAVLGTALFSFTVGLGSASLLKSANKPFLLSLIERALELDEATGVKRPRQSKQAA